MSGNYERLFATYTDEQLLLLSDQSADMGGAGRNALDEEMRRRGYAPHKESAAPNYARLFAQYTDTQLSELAKQRFALSTEARIAFDEAVQSRAHLNEQDQSQLTEPSTVLSQTDSKSNSVRKFFVRAPHWQLFLLVFGLYFAGEILTFASLPTSSGARSFRDLGPYGISGEVLMVLSDVCFFLWLWSVGTFLSAQMHPVSRPDTSFLKFSVAYQAVFFLFAFGLLSFTTQLDLWALVPLLVGMLVFFLSALYSLYLVSKCLVLADVFRRAPFFAYARPFLLIVSFPIGIWFIQPRINRRYESRALQARA